MLDIKIIKRIWGKEATLLGLLRRYSYGKFTVVKEDGNITRMLAEQSILIKEGEDILDDLD